jgi:hypothetical protein
MSLARVILRPHRVEAVAVAIVTVLAFVVAGGLVLRLLAYGIPAECFARAAGESCIEWQPEMAAYGETNGTWGFFAVAAVTLLPAVSGILFGISLVGKEIDQGTSTFAWAVAPSRRRWLLQRVLPIGVAIVIVGFAAGAIADIVAVMREPGTDPNGSLAQLGIRGPMIGAETLAYFGLALLLGAIVGRVLPALLLSIVLVFLAFGGVTALTDSFLETETVLTNGMDGGVPGRVVEYMLLSPEGDVMSYMQAYARYGEEAMEAEGGPGATFRNVLRINPPELYPIAVARMFILYAALGLAAIVLSFAVVERRRPT